MKTILKTILTTILFFSFTSVCLADDPIKSDETKESISETKEFCLENIEKKGCLYDPNDELYTKSGRIENENWVIRITSNNTNLVRGYQAVDSDGNLVFAGCYKDSIKSKDYWELKVNGGDMYVFKIVKLQNGECKVTDSDIVPAKGVSYNGINDFYITVTHDGQSALGADMAIYEGWTAENGGSCPKIFGLTANTKWYTKTSNKYAFTDDSTGFLHGKGMAFSSDVYERSTGCTINDKEGYEEAKACFDEAMASIDEYKCPSDMSDLSKMSDDLAKYQKQCDSKLAVLYANKLLTDNAKEFSDKLKAKAEEKANSCQYNDCNISSTQIQKIIDAKAGTKCEKGCSISIKEQSEAKNAQCYCCGGSRGCSYTWTDKPSSSCSKSNKTKDKCVGTTDTDLCLTCLEDAYKKAGLNSAQRKCMIETDIKKSQVVTSLKEDIDDQFDDQVEEKLKENEELYNSIEKYEFNAELPSQGFGEGGETCEEVVGKNIAKLIKLALSILRIAGAIIAIVNGMMSLIPAVVSKDPEALKKAGNKCLKMGVILLIIGVFPTILRVIGKIFGYDLSCIFG